METRVKMTESIVAIRFYEEFVVNPAMNLSREQMAMVLAAYKDLVRLGRVEALILESFAIEARSAVLTQRSWHRIEYEALRVRLKDIHEELRALVGNSTPESNQS